MIYPWIGWLGRWIRERKQTMFNTLGGNDDEVRKWRKRTIFSYLQYLENMKAMNDKLSEMKPKPKPEEKWKP